MVRPFWQGHQACPPISIHACIHSTHPPPTHHHKQDFQGQKLSEYLYYYIIILCGAAGWIYGYWYVCVMCVSSPSNHPIMGKCTGRHG